ncbi:hypothetical protein D3C78_1059090 [compost metagenome]
MGRHVTKQKHPQDFPLSLFNCFNDVDGTAGCPRYQSKREIAGHQRSVFSAVEDQLPQRKCSPSKKSRQDFTYLLGSDLWIKTTYHRKQLTQIIVLRDLPHRLHHHIWANSAKKLYPILHISWLGSIRISCTQLTPSINH